MFLAISLCRGVAKLTVLPGPRVPGSALSIARPGLSGHSGLFCAGHTGAPRALVRFPVSIQTGGYRPNHPSFGKVRFSRTRYVKYWIASVYSFRFVQD